ncbi:hypothetical protein [Haloarcula sp. 1CSR25-25]|uniref:hypothetical protein n=1 Tax=Haloarcula sp. 1CSR25-25 TaxID=2862545 RepID=UPI002895A448|nr:hypothetical protein [Haloarcula sp. 1CSR25-25]MDT3435571.1 hypothetical protein [Haloarcula sp. 1CSR25-25]
MTDWKGRLFLTDIVVLTGAIVAGSIPINYASDTGQTASTVSKGPEQPGDPSFDIEIISTSQPVRAGKTLRVNFSVTSTGAPEDTRSAFGCPLKPINDWRVSTKTSKDTLLIRKTT